MQVGKFTDTEMCVTLQPKNKSGRQNHKRNTTAVLQAIPTTAGNITGGECSMRDKGGEYTRGSIFIYGIFKVS
jgi:hypothetical protein